MKNRILFCLLFLSFSVATSKAQIPNAGFEDWDTNGDPVGWVTSNAPPSYTTITKSSSAHFGSWAAEGNVAAFSSFNVAPTLYSGNEGDLGVPINSRPASLEGYYKFTSAGGDILEIEVFLYKDSLAIGSGVKLLNAVGSYTKFNCDIIYFDPTVVPDTALILILAANTTTFFTNVGTKFFIDDLAWSNTTDIGEYGNQIPTEFSLMQNYPNPFNPSTSIRYEVSNEQFVSVKVFDVLGNEVATLVNEEKPAGVFEIEFSAAGLTSGIYFYKLQAGNFTETKKMILLR